MSAQSDNGPVGPQTPPQFHFPRGLPGLDGFHRFLVNPVPGNRLFAMLVAAGDPAVGLILVDPLPFFPGYRVDLFPVDRRDLLLKEERDLVIFTTVAVDDQELYTNLGAPILINVISKRGKQIILPDRTNQLRVPLDPGPEHCAVS